MHRKSLLIFIIAGLLIFQLGGFSVIYAETFPDFTNGGGADWGDGFYRPISVTNFTGSAITDCPVRIVLDTASLGSPYGNIKSNGYDIRFTATDMKTEIPYYMASFSNTSYSYFWVKVPSLPAGDANIYMFYGNISATSASTTTIFSVTDLKWDGPISARSNTPRYFASVIMGDGTVMAWGDNTYGQLGQVASNQCNTAVTNTSLSAVITACVESGCGSYHNLALLKDGTVRAWGKNNYGQLGNNSTTNSETPVIPQGLGNIVDISGSQYHSIACDSGGNAWSWGYNGYGNLGDGTFTQRTVPVQVTGISTAQKVAAGESWSLAKLSDGTVRSWGSNGSGQLGIGITATASSALSMTAISNAITIAANCYLYSSGVILSDGNVNIWGANSSGLFGINSTSPSNSSDPVTPQGISNVRSLAFCSHGTTIACKTDGTVWTWGEGEWGEIGNNSTADQYLPTQVPLITNSAVAVAGGYGHVLALLNDGKVLAWGYNSNGQLGIGTNSPSIISYTVQTSYIGTTNTAVSVAGSNGGSIACMADGKVLRWGATGVTSYLPIEMPYIGTTNTAKSVAAGNTHYLVVMADGKVLSWGTGNSDGQLGDNTNVAKTTYPVEVKYIGTTNTAVAVAGGYNHSLALMADGTVLAWGDNQYGELGDGTSGTDRWMPVTVTGLTNVVSIAAGYYHSMAVTADGKVWAWGYNNNGQLGQYFASSYTTPRVVKDLSNVKDISGGGSHSLAVKNDGTVWAWGSQSSYGQLGDNSTTQRNWPIKTNYIGTTNTAIAVTAGYYHSLALMNNGKVLAWGCNNNGQLGDNSQTNRYQTVEVKYIGTTNTAIAVAAGYYHSVALMADGKVLAWGDNSKGQLGDGNATTDQWMPITVPGISNAVAIAAGAYHTIAITADGTIWAWGDNTEKQLAYPNLGDVLTPQAVTNLSNVRSLTHGYYHSAACKRDGTVWGWGRNTEYQLGDGTITSPRTTPIQTQFIGVTNTAVAVTAGQYHSLSLMSDGKVLGWGYNASGQLGDNTQVNRNLPIQVKWIGITNTAVAIAAAQDHSFAVMSDGKILAWGVNSNYALGDGTAVTPRLQTIQIPFIGTTNTAVAVVSGEIHGLALMSDGTILGWGWNLDGELANTGAGMSSPYTVQVAKTVITTTYKAVAIAAGQYHSLALAEDGLVWAWGSDSNGQLGNGAGGGGATPVSVTGLTNVVAIAAGTSSSYALKADGTLWAWGRNSDGELGDGTGVASQVPVQVAGPLNIGKRYDSGCGLPYAVGKASDIYFFRDILAADPKSAAPSAEVTAITIKQAKTSNWVDLVKGKEIKMGQSIAQVSFTMNTNGGTAHWKRFRIDKGITGVATPVPDAKIEAQVWMENNGNGFWDSGDTLISKGNFANGTCYLNMKRHVVSAQAKTYYIVYKLSDNIGGGQKAGVKVGSGTWLEFEDAVASGVPQ
jgi:alpha-tubulin suppressor-like RCC1 family protein